MYQVFLGYMPLPIAPSKIETKIGSRNRTIELIDGNQVSILKGAELTEIEFSFLMPSQKYPFMSLAGDLAGDLLGEWLGEVNTTAIMEWLEHLKSSREKFQFIVVRLGHGLNLSTLYNTDMTVTLEDYQLIEDANNGMDLEVKVNLREWRPNSSLLYDTINKVIEKVRP